MNIQQFQYILAVVELKNFEAAAEKCFITQSTLSTMIRKFEDEIGIKIFNRKTKPVTITQEGHQIINRLSVINNEINLMKNMIQEIKGDTGGELKMGIIPTIAPYLLPLFLNDFANAFPRIKILIKEITTTEIQKELKSRNIDIGILAIPLNNNDLNELELYSEPFLVYDHTGKVNKKKISIEDLDYSKLCLLAEGHCLRTQILQLCEQSDKLDSNNINFKLESGSMDTLFKVTKMRKGITIIPHLASLDLLNDEKNKLVGFRSPIPVRKVGLVTHKFFVKKKLLYALQELIQKSVSGLIHRKEKQNVLNPIDE